MNHPLNPIAEADERAIDQALAQWVLKRTGSPLLASAVRAASAAEGQGHSHAQLTDPYTDVGFDAEALTTLRQHDWVGNGQRFTPFVLDAQNHFYLWRNWQHESTLANAILRRCGNRSYRFPPTSWPMTSPRYSAACHPPPPTGNVQQLPPCPVPASLY
jgi:exodeoxyribonuclease V alpha subunit